jgi:hypothetical protein
MLGPFTKTFVQAGMADVGIPTSSSLSSVDGLTDRRTMTRLFERTRTFAAFKASLLFPRR